MPEKDLIDTQKKQFFQDWENYTFFEKAALLRAAVNFYLRRHFQSLKTRFWIA